MAPTWPLLSCSQHLVTGTVVSLMRVSVQDEGNSFWDDLPHPDAGSDHFRAFLETAARGGDTDERSTLGDSDWRLQAQHQVVATPPAGGETMTAAKRAPAPQRPATTDVIVKRLVGGWLGIKMPKNEAEEAKVEAFKKAKAAARRQEATAAAEAPFDDATLLAPVRLCWG